MNLNRNKKILLGLLCLGLVLVFYKYFNVVEGLSNIEINDYKARMEEITKQFMPIVTKYDTPEVINAMNSPLNVRQSIDDLKQTITHVQTVYAKIIDAGNFPKDKKKAKKLRNDIQDAKNKADASYSKANASYKQTLIENPINPEHQKPGSFSTSSEILILYINKTLDSVKIALDILKI
jgi:hypothetical protein